MSLGPLREEFFWDINIRWSRPSEYNTICENGSPLDETAYLYHIIGRFSGKGYKSFYIGCTYDQWISKRLSQPDHRKKYWNFITNYPKHRFYVSCGNIDVVKGKITRKRIKDIEAILIYANDSGHTVNRSHSYTHGAKTSYRIRNNGYRVGLPKEIHYGIFVQR